MLFLSEFNETEFCRNIFEKYPKVKFHENPSSGKRIFSAHGQTDRRDETN